MIIGITGKAGSGKNTVGKMIQALDAGCNNKSILYLLEIAKDNQELNFENTSFQIKSFAFKIKQILCILTGCTMNQLENREFKEKKLPSQWKVWVVVIGKAPTIYERKVARTEEIAKNIVREN